METIKFFLYFFAVIVIVILFFYIIQVLVPNFFHKTINKIKIRHKTAQYAEGKSDGDLLQWLKEITPREFEDHVGGLFSKMGYKTKVVGKSHDDGIDVIATKDGVEHLIQVKRYNTSNVSVKTIREFMGVLGDKRAQGKGYIITTSEFTLEARQFAEGKPIELIGGLELIKYIRIAEKNGDK